MEAPLVERSVSLFKETPKRSVDGSFHGFFYGEGSSAGFRSHGLHSATTAAFTPFQLLELDRQILIYNHMVRNVSVSSSLPTNIPQFFQSSESSNFGNTGYKSYGLNCAAKAPFTSFQLRELTEQILIYGHMAVNMPVPSKLLVNILKFGQPSGSSKSKNAKRKAGSSEIVTKKIDAEPGRCHRTDGKKWRCSKEVVQEEKYCEHHLKRGRFRGRKCVKRIGEHAASYSTSMNSTMFSTLPVMQQKNKGMEIGSNDDGNINI